MYQRDKTALSNITVCGIISLKCYLMRCLTIT